jgi:ribosomal protein S18 acetylase RimI-like enzyme
MANNFIYQRGDISDLQKLRQLAITSYAQFKNVLSAANWNKMSSFLNDENTFIQLIQKSIVYKCVQDEVIIGVAYLVPSGNPTHIYQTDWCYIRMVGVDPKYQGNGIAKELTQLCIDYARNSGEKIITLHTSEFMDAARCVYEKIGFEKVKELDPIFDKKYWLYKLDL